MDNKLYNIIKRVYIDKDINFFKDKCKCKLDYIYEMINLVKPFYKSYSISEEDVASYKIVFFYKMYTDKGLSINFKTILRLSKITNIYFLNHEFELKNPFEGSLKPSFYGTGLAYIREQYDLEEKLVDFLDEKGYREIITYHELNEVVNNRELIMSRLTLEKALFKDTWKLCEK